DVIREARFHCTVARSVGCTRPKLYYVKYTYAVGIIREAVQPTGQSRLAATGDQRQALVSMRSGEIHRCCCSCRYGFPRTSRTRLTARLSPAQNETNETVGIASLPGSSS